MTTNKNFRVKNGLEVGADGIKFADNTSIISTGSNVTLSTLVETSTPSGGETFLALGNSLTDTSGNSISLVPYGTAAYNQSDASTPITGQNVFTFPGLNNSSIALDPLPESFGLDDLTIDFWFYANQFGNNNGDTYSAVLSNWNSGGPYFLLNTAEDQQLYFFMSYATPMFTTAPVSLDTWHHAALTRQSGVFKLWFNGVLAATNSSYTGQNVNFGGGGGQMYIGSETGSVRGFDGKVAGVRIIKGLALFTTTFTPPSTLAEYALHSSGTVITTSTVIANLTVNTATVAAIKFGDDTIMTTAASDYDQSLNTSDNVTFNLVSANNNFQLNNTGSSVNLNSGHISNAIHIDMVNGADGRITFSDGTIQTTAASTSTGGSIEVMTAEATTATNTATVRIISISDADNKMAYYDTTDGRWNFIEDGTAVYTLPMDAPSQVEYLVVAGGGGGSSGGGGAGGYSTGTTSTSVGSAITVTVGAGGSGGAPATAGNNSVFGSITSIGGGQGVRIYIAALETTGGSGGSGGGGGALDAGTTYGGAGTAGQGNDGGGNGGSSASPYPAGGGGGAGSVGGNGNASDTAGNGGSGINSSITGTLTGYAGGGGGGTFSPGGNGGTATHGGGAGSSGGTASAATANTGGGGGGGGSNGQGGNGGSGIVVIRYADTFSAAASTTGSPTITTEGGYRVYKWTSSGSITF